MILPFAQIGDVPIALMDGADGFGFTVTIAGDDTEDVHPLPSVYETV